MSSNDIPPPGLDPGPNAEKDFLQLGVGKNREISDRNLVLQKGIKALSLRMAAGTQPDNTAKRVAEHAIATLYKVDRPKTSNRQSLSSLPDEDVIFQALLQSDKSDSDAHPNGLSSMAYAFSCLMNLCVLRHTNDFSSHFDLYPLYGGGPSDFDQVRLKDGSGMLSPDCFFDNRLTLLPRASAVILILFNRNHNYLARRLYLQGDLVDKESPQSTDQKIFEAARHINCALFRNIIMEDMLKPLMGVQSVGPSHGLDLLMECKDAPLGTSFNASVEGSLLYDWSTLMSKEDIQESSIRTGTTEISRQVLQALPTDFELTTNSNKRTRNWAGLKRQLNGFFKDSDLASVLYDATESAASDPQHGFPACQRIRQTKTIGLARSSGACTLNEYRASLGLKPFSDFSEWSKDNRIVQAAREYYSSIDDVEVYVGLHAEDAITSDGGFQFGYTKTFGLMVDIVSRIRTDPALKPGVLSDLNLTSWGVGECAPRPQNGSFGASLPKLLQRTLPRDYTYNSVYALFPLNTPTSSLKYLQQLKLEVKYDRQRPKLRVVHRLLTKSQISYVLNKPDVFPTMYGKRLEDLTSGYGYFLGFDDEVRHDADQSMSLHALIPDKKAMSRYATSFSGMASKCIRDSSKGATNGVGEIDIARDVINAVCTRWVCETLLDYPLKSQDNHKRDVNGGSRPTTGTDAQVPFITRTMNDLLAYAKRAPTTILHRLPTSAQKQVANILIQMGLENVAVPYAAPSDIQDVHASFAMLYEYVFHNVDSENEWQLGDKATVVANRISQHIITKLPPRNVIDLKADSNIFPGIRMTILPFIGRILTELTVGKVLPPQTSATFLSKVVEANEDLLPPEGPFGNTAKGNEARNKRIAANVLGLAVVAAVKYAKICTQAVEFYLRDEHRTQREDIIRCATAEKFDSRSKETLMGYIREAYRLNDPLGVWRCAASDADIPQTSGTSSALRVKAGDHIYADFGRALTDPNDPSLPNPLAIDPKRKVLGIQGLGLHKCPGKGFADETMPELFRAIFSLPNIRRLPSREGSLVHFCVHPDPQETDPRLFLDSKGRLSSFPRSLVVQFDAVDAAKSPQVLKKTEGKRWRLTEDTKIARRRMVMNVIMLVLVTALILRFAFFILASMYEMVSLLWHTPNTSPARKENITTSVPTPAALPPPVPCQPPTTKMFPWEVTMMKAGTDGKLVPLKYTLDHPTAHKVSIMDIDAKDMTMSVWVDNVLIGVTPTVALNKSENCGENIRECLAKSFSAGVIVVPKGNHTVRVEWDGVETPGEDGKIDWGPEGGRRLAWSRDSCAV